METTIRIFLNKYSPIKSLDFEFNHINYHVTWDHKQVMLGKKLSNSHIIGQNVKINGDLPNKDLLQYFYYWKLISVNKENSAFKEAELFDVLAINVIMPDKEYPLSASGLSLFRHITIPLANKSISLLASDFEEICTFCRNKDQQDNLQNAIECNFNDIATDNISDFLKLNIVEYAETFSKVEDYSGEDEIGAINDILNQAGGAGVYHLIMNTGEERDAILMNHLLDSNNSNIYVDRDGDLFNIEDVVSYSKVEDFTL